MSTAASMGGSLQGEVEHGAVIEKAPDEHLTALRLGSYGSTR
jgi:hypothetical protein